MASFPLCRTFGCLAAPLISFKTWTSCRPRAPEQQPSRLARDLDPRRAHPQAPLGYDERSTNGARHPAALFPDDAVNVQQRIRGRLALGRLLMDWRRNTHDPDRATVGCPGLDLDRPKRFLIHWGPEQNNVR